MASLEGRWLLFGRKNRLFLNESECHTYTLYHNNLMDEICRIYNFRDKCLKAYRVKNKNISILKEAK